MIIIYNDAQPWTQNGDVTSLLQLHEWHPTNAYTFLPLATSTRDPHLSTIVESLLLSWCCSSSGYFSLTLTLRCHRSTRFCVDHTHVQRKTPRARGTIPSVAQSSPSWKKAYTPLMAQSWKPGRGEFPRQTLWIHGNKDRVAVWWWLILWIFCLLSDPCACEERSAGVDWVFGWWSVLAEDRAMRSIWCFVAARTCWAKHILRSKYQ